MSNYKCQFMFVALFLLALLERAKAVNLKCFTCTTLVNEACWDPFNVSQVVLATECPDDSFYCLKQKIPESYYMIPEELKRGCVPEDYCWREEPRSEYCHLCNTFLCNSSFNLTPPPLVPLLGLILFNLRHYF